MCSEKKCSAHFKVVLDDSWITVDTTLLHQHKLYYSTIALICHIVKTVQVAWFKVPIRAWPVRIKGYEIQCLAKRKFGSGHWQNNNKKTTKYRKKVDALKAKFTEHFWILKETNHSSVLKSKTETSATTGGAAQGCSRIYMSRTWTRKDLFIVRRVKESRQKTLSLWSTNNCNPLISCFSSRTQSFFVYVTDKLAKQKATTAQNTIQWPLYFALF